MSIIFQNIQHFFLKLRYRLITFIDLHTAFNRVFNKNALDLCKNIEFSTMNVEISMNFAGTRRSGGKTHDID